MAHELTKRRLNILKKEPAPIVYDDLRFDKGYEADLIVENKVIVELKSVETGSPSSQETTPNLPASRG